MNDTERARRDAYVRAAVAAFPPLSEAQRARVAGLLAPVATAPKRKRGVA